MSQFLARLIVMMTFAAVVGAIIKFWAAFAILGIFCGFAAAITAICAILFWAFDKVFNPDALH
jgi:hypothetical protein